MKNLLIIGSTVVDVIINVDHLPHSKGDVHILNQEFSLGGCGYNVSDMVNHFNAPYILFSPIGTGIYGDFIRKTFKENGITTPLPTPNMDNGCCYCFVEQTGERTFVSYHGAEYLIYKEWLDTIDLSKISHIYICGLEIEEKTGEDIVSFLERTRDIPIFFAPGPRIVKISSELLERLFSLSVIIHLNDDEALDYTKKHTIEAAAQDIYNKTNNMVIITAGEAGAYLYNHNSLKLIPIDSSSHVIDTIGAGDAHIGAIMASLHKGDDITTAIQNANKAAKAVVETKGALLSQKIFKKLF